MGFGVRSGRLGLEVMGRGSSEGRHGADHIAPCWDVDSDAPPSLAGLLCGLEWPRNDLKTEKKD